MDINTRTKSRIRISRKKPVIENSDVQASTKTIDPISSLSQSCHRPVIADYNALLDFFEIDNSVDYTTMLDSCNNLSTVMEDLHKQRDDMNHIKFTAFTSLMVNLRQCQAIEQQLINHNVTEFLSPKDFLELINSDKNPMPDLSFNSLKKQQEEVIQRFEGLKTPILKEINKPDINNDDLRFFNNRIQQMTSEIESYHFIDQTQGFFCKPVMVAYMVYLKDVYKRNGLK